MKEIMGSVRLTDGAEAVIVRYIPPDDDGGRGLYAVSHEWNTYYKRAFFSGHNEYIEDRVYYAEVDGFPAARLWFAWSKRTFHGNFGNIYTNPGQRRRGLLNALLAVYREEFAASPAKMLCCSASGYRIPLYMRYGLRTLHGDMEHDAMCAIKPEYGSFAEYARNAYRDTHAAKIRGGDPGDQFDCDKFFILTDPMWQTPEWPFVMGSVQSFQAALNRELDAGGATAVAENAAGFVTGYAAAVADPPSCAGYVPPATAGWINFHAFPDMPVDEAAALVGHAAKRFHVLKPKLVLRAAIRPDDARRRSVFARAGFWVEAELGDMTLLRQ